MTDAAKVLYPDSYKVRVEAEVLQMRMEALSEAVKAHAAGDGKESVAVKAEWFLRFLETGKFKG